MPDRDQRQESQREDGHAGAQVKLHVIVASTVGPTARPAAASCRQGGRVPAWAVEAERAGVRVRQVVVRVVTASARMPAAATARVLVAR